VSAKDKASNKEQSIRITSSSGLSKEEVEKMKHEAQAHASEDKKKKEEIDLRNQADNLTFQTEKQLKDFGEKVSGDLRSKIEAANTALKEAIKSNNATTIKGAMEVLNAAWNEASTQMYQQATTAGGQQQTGSQEGPAGGAAPKGDDKKVEDADFEVMDDKK
jgi:molecular chaperone DnaK